MVLHGWSGPEPVLTQQLGWRERRQAKLGLRNGQRIVLIAVRAPRLCGTPSPANVFVALPRLAKLTALIVRDPPSGMITERRAWFCGFCDAHIVNPPCVSKSVPTPSTPPFNTNECTPSTDDADPSQPRS
jgi:hypothetical protein